MGMLHRMFVIISDYPTTARVQRGGFVEEARRPVRRRFGPVFGEVTCRCVCLLTQSRLEIAHEPGTRTTSWSHPPGISSPV